MLAVIPFAVGQERSLRLIGDVMHGDRLVVLVTKYPLTNTIFEDSKTAILYQNKKRFSLTFKLHTPNDVSDLLHQFFTYVEPDIENFEEAVDEFKERIPEHAQALVNIIREEHKLNKKFKVAFSSFADLCRTSIDPQMDDAAI